METLETTTPARFKTWRVNGTRCLGGGATRTLLATAFGRDEASARHFFHRHVNKPSPPGTIGAAFTIWADHELTFTETENEE